MVRLKRVYEAAAAGDGYRVLVDRLWPRGLRKEDAGIDDWMKDLAPSGALRKWFAHDPSRFREFCKRYKSELETADAQRRLDDLTRRAARKTVTLLYAAHDTEHNNAVVLAQELERRKKRRASSSDSRAPLLPRRAGANIRRFSP